ncbi:MAG: xylose isomerase, partial [Mycobacteriales bacterium]
VPELTQPTLAAGETIADLQADIAGFDPETAATRGMHYERLDQLAMDHLLGAR